MRAVVIVAILVVSLILAEAAPAKLRKRKRNQEARNLLMFLKRISERRGAGSPKAQAGEACPQIEDCSSELLCHDGICYTWDDYNNLNVPEDTSNYGGSAQAGEACPTYTECSSSLLCYEEICYTYDGFLSLMPAPEETYPEYVPSADAGTRLEGEACPNGDECHYDFACHDSVCITFDELYSANNWNTGEYTTLPAPSAEDSNGSNGSNGSDNGWQPSADNMTRDEGEACPNGDECLSHLVCRDDVCTIPGYKRRASRRRH